MRISDWSSDVCSSDLLDRADTALPLGGPEALEVLASDRALQACLRALLGDRDFDDILVAAQGYYLALLDAHAAALPLCRTMERTRNTALQQRTHFRIWLERGVLAGQTNRKSDGEGKRVAV